MKTITTNELTTVTGGAAKNDALTAQVTALGNTVKDLASAQNKPADNNNMMTMVLLASALKPQSQPTVVAGGAPAAAGPVVNISSRFGRR